MVDAVWLGKFLELQHVIVCLTVPVVVRSFYSATVVGDSELNSHLQVVQVALFKSNGSHPTHHRKQTSHSLLLLKS